MVKLTKESRFKAQGPNAETKIEKTTRIARTLLQEEAEQRQTKNDQLRNARLEREANTPAKVARGRKTSSSKAAK